MLNNNSIFILLFFVLSSCKNKSKTPIDFVDITIGNISNELGKSGYYIKTNGDFQVTPDSTIPDQTAFRFFRKNNKHRYFGIIGLGSKQLDYASDPYLSDVSHIKIVQSVVLGKTRNWKIYDTGVMGYLGILDGDNSCLVSAPEIQSLDTLIAIASSIARE